jgi:hypothetical protein
LSSGLAGISCTKQAHADLQELTEDYVKGALEVLKFLSAL